MYVPNDPREQLVTIGNRLLDTIYRKSQWELEHAELEATIKRGKDSTEEEMLAATSQPNFIEAVVDRLKIDAELQKFHHEYAMLRSTIEAMSAPRTDIPTAYDMMGDN